MNTAQRICQSCGYIGIPKRVVPGNFITELLLLCMLIIPGLIYTVWRKTHIQSVCPKCGQNATMIPLDSPMGRRLAETLAVASATK